MDAGRKAPQPHFHPINAALTERGPTTGALDATLIGNLLDRSHTTAPHDVAQLAADELYRAGAVDVAFWMQDYDQQMLHALAVTGHAAAQDEAIDGTVAGGAFTRHAAVERVGQDGGTRVWLPLLDGTDRVGVMALTLEDIDDELRGHLRRLAANIAHLFFSKGKYTDEYFRLRRSRELRLAAEMQWALLPPLNITTPQVAIAGLLEPAYEVAGDSFDYALNAEGLHFAIFDAMGHGLTSAIMATTAISAYRHARRSRVPLRDMYGQIDQILGTQFGVDTFATAQMGLLDVGSGAFEWVNAGHPPPVLVRDGAVRFLEGDPTLPVGFGGADPTVVREQLEPRDRLLFFTDGVIEQRNRRGEMIGERVLAERLVQHLAEEVPSAEVLRRVNRDLLEIAGGQGYSDDATMVLIYWMGPQDVISGVTASGA